MKIVRIKIIALDANGCLEIYPQDSQNVMYQQIYRTATGIRWNEENNSLFASEPGRWDALDLYTMIVRAVSTELGVLLKVSSETIWIDVPVELMRDIEKSSSSSNEHRSEKIPTSVMRRYVGDLRTVEEAKKLFKLADYTAVKKLYSELKYPDELSKAESKLFEIANRKLGL